MSRKTILSPFMKQCFVTTALGLNSIALGCGVGFPAILLPQLSEPDSGFELTKGEESWIASIFALSVLVGSFITTPISDRLGRKGTHVALTVPCIIGWFMIILATDVKIIIIGRTINGITAGVLSVLRAVLIGECTSPRNRGAFLTTISLTQAFGIFFVHLIGSFLSWRSAGLVCAFFPFVSLLMIIYTPESPSWLAGEGRYDECAKEFRWLRGDEEEEELREMIKAQIELAREKINNSSKNNNRFKAALNTAVKKEFYKPLILMVHANIIMQFTGACTMASYSTVILGWIMGPDANTHFWMVFLDTQRIITNTIAIYVINKVKRRTMMFSGGGLCVVSHLAIAFYVLAKIRGWMQYESIWLPALLINIQIFTVGMSVVPMPNIIAGEVFPLEYRGIGGTISMSSGGITMFLVLKTFPQLINLMGIHGTYLLYAIIITYNLGVMWILLPETKGRTLQQIEDEFRGRSLMPHEIEARNSLQNNPLEAYKRKISEGKISLTFE